MNVKLVSRTPNAQEVQDLLYTIETSRVWFMVT
jgi:hypothetical protein